MSITPRLISNTGRFNGTTQETKSLLDEARSTILDITRRIESGEIACKGATNGPTASVSPSPRSGMIVSPKSKLFNPAPKPAAAKQKNPPAAPTAAARPTPTAARPTAPPPTNKFHGAPVGLVATAATHRSSPESDKAQALAELQARGVILNPNGTISRSIRGGREVRLASKK